VLDVFADVATIADALEELDTLIVEGILVAEAEPDLLDLVDVESDKLQVVLYVGKVGAEYDRLLVAEAFELLEELMLSKMDDIEVELVVAKLLAGPVDEAEVEPVKAERSLEIADGAPLEALTGVDIDGDTPLFHGAGVVDKVMVENAVREDHEVIDCGINEKLAVEDPDAVPTLIPEDRDMTGPPVPRTVVVPFQTK
jgi:hypothetical protein